MSARVETLPQIAELIRELPPELLPDFAKKFNPEEARSILDDWNLWAMPHQRLPPGEWRRWVLRAGRGGGKTHAAARIVNELARDRSKIRTGEIAIVGRTYTNARSVCVEGPSGILQTAPADFRPKWYPGKGLLVWPNAVRGWVFSGDTSASVLGTNAAVVWADEVCQWPDPETAWWKDIEPALRIGWARAILTTTPKPTPFLRKLEALEDTVVTRATTYDNPWLDKGALRALEMAYKGTRLGLQELKGEILDDLIGALWKCATIERHRVNETPQDLEQVLVSIDPAVTANEDSDETGIVGLGRDRRRHGYMLADESGKYEATEWPSIAVSLYHRLRADKIIAEVNNGGDLVELAIRSIDPNIPFESVRATRGKVLRAEPVAGLYERGLVHHVGFHSDAETQLTSWIPGHKSPDRLDAIVHGFTKLLLDDVAPVGSIDAYL